MTDLRETYPEMREERRPITVLVADIVGSTTLAEQLDETEVRLVLGEAIARMVVEIERLGGYVKDLAGDGVLAFFGAPVASEDDAERALLAGLAIVETIGAYAEEVEQSWGTHDFAVRAGVTTGPVVVGALGAGERVEYAAFGDTVNTAARLQGAAAAGTVLVDEETRRLVEPLFDWGSPEEHELKGKKQPVLAYRPLRAHPVIAKPRGLEGIHSPLIGRGHELERVRSLIEALSTGSGGVLLVTGEAGIGKSRLLFEARRSFDGIWLEGRCVSYGESLPYWPIRDLLREWLGVAQDDPELRVRVALRRSVEHLFGTRTLEIYPYLCSLLGLTPEPEAAARLADLSPEALQYRTFEVVEELIVTLATDRPVVVVLEDLHWADATSVQLVERLLPIAEQAAVLLVIAQRDERDHASWQIRERAAREFPHVLCDLRLEALSGNAPQDLLEAIVGHDALPESVARQLVAAAEGNPFYLEELVRSLMDAGALVAENGRWRLDHEIPVEVPPTVERVILARIDRLTPACHDVLTAASTLGRTFSLPLLEAVLERDVATEGSLHELQRLDLLRVARRWPQPDFRFKHALIQEAAHRTLLPDRRASLHRAAAEWLERQYEGTEGEVLGLLAYHWLAANDEAKAVTYLARAGDRARLEWSLDEAIEHYRELLPLLERRDERREMALTLFKLALALHQALRFAEANDAYQRGFELWVPEESASATETLRVGMSEVPSDADPYRTHRILNIKLYMALFDRLVETWPGRTIVPSLAKRWEVSDDGLRYVFHLHEGLRWSDGAPLTAHDVEFGVKRVLDRERPGASVAIYFVLENAQEYFAGSHDDLSRVGVRALDDHTVEFRLAAPAPYFMSVLNRPDGAPHPRHAIESLGDAWTEPRVQVVSGAFRREEHTEDRVVLERRPESFMPRRGNVRRVELLRVSSEDAPAWYARDDLDMFNTRFEHVESLANASPEDVQLDPPAWLEYLALRFADPALSRLEFRRALAHAIDRSLLEHVAPSGAIVATGGMVPPPLQGHTPDIAPVFDPDLARDYLERSEVREGVEILAWGWNRTTQPVISAVAAGWEEVLGLRFPVRFAGLEEHDSLETSAAILQTGWFPGYPDPEYYLRLLLHSEATDNHGGYSSAAFDSLIQRARLERDGRTRLELFHEADRMAVADQVAAIPLLYDRNVIFVKPWVSGWWEYGKSWSSFADLVVGEKR